VSSLSDARREAAATRKPGLALSRAGLAWGLGLLGLVFFPFFAPGPFWISLASEVFVLALWAVSLDLLLGYTGLISFGHAAYFGLGAYAAALFMIHLAPSLLVGLLGGTLVAGLLATLVGWLSVRRPGVAFSMLTLAFAQVFYTAIFKWRGVTGGDDGLRGIPRPSVALGPLSFDATDRMHLYWLTLLALAGSLWLLRRVVGSPFGAVLEAIRENEERARFIGYETQRYKLIAFALAGTFAGLAGALFTLIKGFLVPSVLHWTASGQVLMMAILGGTGTLFGPVVGALVYLVAQDVISSYTEHWLLFFGALFVLVVLVAPGGIAGLVRARRAGRAE
jgi:branched-chain amino acid transport system permease protein